MEQGIVENTSSQEVSVMWDGYQVVFKPRQKRIFGIYVAQHIANESEALQLVDGEDPAMTEEAKADGEEELPKVPVIKCKKCSFETTSKGALLAHYSKEHKTK